jgi:hypothetical protein
MTLLAQKSSMLFLASAVDFISMYSAPREMFLA